MSFTPELVAKANAMRKNSLVELLGMEFIASPPGTFAARMPVDARTHQPMGLLHGGATAALAETVGSMGSSLLINMKTHGVVGIEVNANHLKGVRSGYVTCTGTLLHKGRTTHVWDFKVTNDANELVAVCRLVIMIIALTKKTEK
ncbi:MAG: PaaI family thioesterase [Flavobacteriales bacterium]|nr:PaaI family thioesterase [Flavobacteriales bacterium]HQV50659.1 PaaI family thioesterase [Flavobacteriales bacterium]HQX28777.1 PaaI family thioesterase [Flavobacteriales bacterium]HQX37315.1 PaaI family thioesterase [Flavobacteriales bacterium]HQZ91661.1 PaaI family thioesterase [Flavobacteriales bacterium]